jgi:hypothetical protein
VLRCRTSTRVIYGEPEVGPGRCHRLSACPGFRYARSNIQLWDDMSLCLVCQTSVSEQWQASLLCPSNMKTDCLGVRAHTCLLSPICSTSKTT